MLTRALTNTLSKLLTSGLALGLCVGCGGNQDADTAPLSRASLRAQHVVAPGEMSDLSHCLEQLASALQKQAGTEQLSLHCASGTYRGQNSAGRLCELKIDAATGMFRFQLEREVVSILWGNVAYASDGRPIHNLEDASTVAQPGIQLSRFTGSLTPQTEILILRLDAGISRLPKMIYQRTADGATQSAVCNFGR